MARLAGSQRLGPQPSLWLVIYKKHTGTPCVSYDEAVEEALCFGWIDGQIKRLDDNRYAQRFSPRKPGSNWSESNKVRVRRLIAEGQMTPAGLATVTLPLDPTEDAPMPQAESALSEHLLARLQVDPAAWASSSLLPPSHRRQYAGWIMGAARRETRQRRLERSHLETHHEPAVGDEMRRESMGRRIDMIGIFVTDLARMVAFYRDVLGFAITGDGSGPYAEFVNDGVRFAMYGRAQLPGLLGQTPRYPAGLNGTFELAIDLPTSVDAVSRVRAR